jgi:tRNA pseudouridine38-40 synthase
LQKAIEDLVGEKVNVTGASRTDSGVHALGQVVVFDTSKQIPAWKFTLAINQRLPKDIVVQSSEEVPLDFHPRYTGVVKTYEYRILNRRVQLPNERLYSYFVPKKLNVDSMREAAAYLIGEHDFRSFCSQKTDVLSTVRTVYSLTLEEQGDMIILRITGNGFLYNMVRIITGALLKVGFEQKTPEEIREAVEHPSGIVAGPTAPAHGLTLVEIQYLSENNETNLQKND